MNIKDISKKELLHKDNIPLSIVLRNYLGAINSAINIFFGEFRTYDIDIWGNERPDINTLRNIRYESAKKVIIEYSELFYYAGLINHTFRIVDSISYLSSIDFFELSDKWRESFIKDFVHNLKMLTGVFNLIRPKDFINETVYKELEGHENGTIFIDINNKENFLNSLIIVRAFIKDTMELFDLCDFGESEKPMMRLNTIQDNKFIKNIGIYELSDDESSFNDYFLYAFSILPSIENIPYELLGDFMEIDPIFFLENIHEQ